MQNKQSVFTAQIGWAALTIFALIYFSIRSDNSTAVEMGANALRLFALLSHLSMAAIQCGGFILISKMLYTSSFNKSFNSIRFLWLDKFPNSKQLLIMIGIVILIYPLIMFLYALNREIPISSFLSGKEEDINGAVELIVNANNIPELLLTIIVVGIVPPFSEELFYRGIFQRLLQAKMNHHLAIWTSGFVFSAIHMQFEGFIPRMVLGSLLGYLYFYSGSIWTCIIAHGIFNSSQIVLAYANKDLAEGLDEFKFSDIETSGWILLITSTVLCVYLCLNFYKAKTLRSSQLPESSFDSDEL